MGRGIKPLAATRGRHHWSAQSKASWDLDHPLSSGTNIRQLRFKQPWLGVFNTAFVRRVGGDRGWSQSQEGGSGGRGAWTAKEKRCCRSWIRMENSTSSFPRFFFFFCANDPRVALWLNSWTHVYCTDELIPLAPPSGSETHQFLFLIKLV